MNEITSIKLLSTNRPDLAPIEFSLNSASDYILERMDGWSGISSINTFTEPYGLSNGSSVSYPNSVGGKAISYIIHVTGQNETETIENLNHLNGILANRTRLEVIDNEVEFYIDPMALAEGSYSSERRNKTHYMITFMLVGESAYKTKSEEFSQVISAGGDLLSGGIVYPTFDPRDDQVNYDTYQTPINTITSIFQDNLVYRGTGISYPRIVIEGDFYAVTVIHTNDQTGDQKMIQLVAQGAAANSYHKWEIDTEALTVKAIQPNPGTDPNWNDDPIILRADWFSLTIGNNDIKVDIDGEGTATAFWRELYI